MRKISFGSFPLTEVKKEDRKCLDKYLIKTFSDNISISDAVRNLSATKNLMYITPDALMRDWMNVSKKSELQPDRASGTLYEGILQRAFVILKEFYSSVQNAPFYKEYIYYPIYVESIEKATAAGSRPYDVQYTDVTMNYSFVILSNDLTKGLHVDEIRYDENASLNFLYLFVEFFSGGDSEVANQSIHDFSKKDYEFLVQLYQFIEKSGKEPIQMVLDLYKIIGFITKIKDTPKGGAGYAELRKDLNKFFDDIQVQDLKRYEGLLRHNFITLIRGRNKAKDTRSLRETFVDIMSSIFKSDNLSGLYDGVKNSASRGERHAYVYNVNKYNEVLNIAKELVKYNELKCKDVVSKDNIDIDFKLERGNKTLDLKSSQISQQYQTFFKDYIDSIKSFVDGMVQELVEKSGAEKSIQSQIGKDIASAKAELGGDSGANATGLYRAFARAKKATDDANNTYKRAQTTGGDLYSAQLAITSADTEMRQAESDIQHMINWINMLKNQQRTVPAVTKAVNSSAIDELSNSMMSALATSLTFVYDDGKRFFTNELVADGFISLADPNNTGKAGTSHNVAIDSGFAKTIVDANNKSVFPNDESTAIENSNPNPEYLTAQVVKSLSTSFDVMASDAKAIFADQIIPTLQTHYRTMFDAKAEIPSTKGNKVISKQTQELQVQAMVEHLLTSLTKTGGSGHNNELLTNITGKLQIEIFQNRFIDKVLKKFLRLFEVHEIKELIQFDDKVSQLHPLIRKLLQNKDKRKGGECQFFKSFIIDYDMVEQLYRLKFITDTQKFLDGIDNQPPRKFNDPMSRMKVVLHDYLGLEFNPTWVISQQNIFLSMPDDLSLTNTSILSKIPKADLMQVCRIQPQDYWSGENMGKVARIGDPKIKRLVQDIGKNQKEIDKLESEVKDLRDKSFNRNQTVTEGIQLQLAERESIQELLEEKSSGNNGKTDKNGKPWNNNNNNGKNGKNGKKYKDSYTNDINTKNKRIIELRKKIDHSEEQIAKNSTEFHNDPYHPHMFAFDDPDMTTNQPLLSDAERDDINRNKDQMKENLLNLNPYSAEDVQRMEDNQSRIDSYQKVERSHPYDFDIEKTPQDSRVSANGYANEASNEDPLPYARNPRDGYTPENMPDPADTRDLRDQREADREDPWNNRR